MGWFIFPCGNETRAITVEEEQQPPPVLLETSLAPLLSSQSPYSFNEKWNYRSCLYPVIIASSNCPSLWVSSQQVRLKFQFKFDLHNHLGLFPFLPSFTWHQDCLSSPGTRYRSVSRGEWVKVSLLVQSVFQCHLWSYISFMAFLGS